MNKLYIICKWERTDQKFTIFICKTNVSDAEEVMMTEEEKKPVKDCCDEVGAEGK